MTPERICSVCIATYKRPDCLNSILAQLMILKNAPFNEIVIAVTGEYSDSINEQTISILRGMELEGLNVHVNSGLGGLYEAKCYFKEIAKNDIVLILDDDIVLTENYFSLLKHFDDSNVAAVSGAVVTPVNFYGFDFFEYSPIDNPPSDTLVNEIVFEPFEISNKYQVCSLKENQIYKCQTVIGSALFIRKNLLSLDKRFYGKSCWLEETDFTYNLYRQGYTLLFDSGSTVYHLVSSHGGMRATEADYSSNIALFKEKYS